MANLDAIIAKLKELGEAELEVVEVSIKDAANQFAPEVLASAKDAVVQAANLALPGTAKKEIAFKAIGENLLAQGIIVGVQVAVSMVYRMIEVAFDWFMENIVGIRPGAPNTGLPFGAV